MVQQIFQFSSVGAGAPQVNLGTNDDAFIAENAVIGSEDDIAIRGIGSGHQVNVQGTVVGTDAAIELGDTFADAGQFVLVGESAYVTTASTVDAAIIVRGDGSLVDNRGTIWGAVHGLTVGGDGFASTSITNSGLIEGVSSAVSRLFASTETVVMHNTGEIRSLGFSYFGSGFPGGKDILTNSGLMDGNIYLGEGDDRYDGQLGRVTAQVDAGGGADTLLGGAFSEDFTGKAGADILDGGGGDDELYGEGDNDSLAGGAGNDLLEGSTGADGLDGGAGDDILTGGSGGDTVVGGAGNDQLQGNEDNDSLLGGDGDDVLDGDAGADSVVGGAGNDMVYGGSGADSLSGGAGNDWYSVKDVGDVVSEAGGSGIDLVESSISFSLLNASQAVGAIENLTLTGNAAINGTGNALANVITGNGSNNILDGLTGNDRLNGGIGLDTLRGGLGNDTLTGGAAKDNFVFNTAPNTATNRDIVTDFVHGLDKLHLENAVFAKLGAAGALKAANFRAGAVALDANDFIVYNKATGILSYDPNGNAAGGAVQVALLMAKPTLTTVDFVLI